MSGAGKRGGDAGPPPMKPDERERVIKALKEVGVYEDNMDDKLIIQLFKFLGSTESEAKSDNDNRESSKTPEPPPPQQQPQQEKMCYSKAVNSNKSNISQQGQTSPDASKKLQNVSASPEKQNDSSDEAIFSVGPKTNSRHSFHHMDSKDAETNINKNRRSMNESAMETTNETKRGTRANCLHRPEEKIPKWKICIANIAPNEKDKPLMSRFDDSSEQNCDDDNAAFVSLEDRIARISLHLREVSENLRWQQLKAARQKSPWGQPIKEGPANDSPNESLNVEEAREAEPPDEMIDFDAGPSRTGRRMRAASRICLNKLRSNASEEIDYPDSEEEFQEVKNKKKLQPEKMVVESDAPQETYSNINEIPRRRKHSSDEGAHNFEALLDDSDEDNNVTKRKKPRITTKESTKKPIAKKPASSRSARMKNVEPISIDEHTDESLNTKDDSDEVTICETANASQPSNDSKRSNVAEVSSSSYPRRIVPPARKGSKYSGINNRKPLRPNVSSSGSNLSREYKEADVPEVTLTSARGRSSVGLQEDEIAEVLENDDDEAQEPSSSVSTDNALSRPLNRILKAAGLLVSTKKKEEEAKKLREQEMELQEEEIDRKKQARLRQRIREQAEKVKAQELEQKRRTGVEERYKELLSSKHRRAERTELDPEGLRRNQQINDIEMKPDNYINGEHADNDVQNNESSGSHSQSKKQVCPICNKKFPVEEIVNHAASCEAYDSGTTADGSRSNSPVVSISSKVEKSRRTDTELFKCSVCPNFVATNGRDFESHVSKCLTRRRSGDVDGGGNIVMVPDSPLRTVRPSSEQTDSEIDYRGQFKPKTRSNIGAKRKRP